MTLEMVSSFLAMFQPVVPAAGDRPFRRVFRSMLSSSPGGLISCFHIGWAGGCFSSLTKHVKITFSGSVSWLRSPPRLTWAFWVGLLEVSSRLEFWLVCGQHSGRLAWFPVAVNPSPYQVAVGSGRHTVPKQQELCILRRGQTSSGLFIIPSPFLHLDTEAS